MTHHTIFLDWDGTLCTDRFWQTWQAPGNPHYHTFRTIENHIFARPEYANAWMRGAMTTEDIVHKLPDDLPVSKNAIFEHLIESAQSMRFSHPSVPGLLARLRLQGHRLVIATDNMDTFPRWTVPALGLDRHIDGILDSHTLRSLKRDPNHQGTSAFFGPYLDQYNLHPGQTLLIDDSADTAAAARSWGINTIHIERGGLTPILQGLLKEI